jgi:sigma-E factor negative regulatory protein RseC
MLKENAMVVSNSHGLAKVAIARSEACGSCPAKSMCSTGTGNINILEVRNPVDARPGEKVVIELRPATLVKATAMLYLLPAIAMVMGATIGWLRAGSDLGAMAGALAGLVIAFLFLYIHGRMHKSVKGPTISKVLSTGDIQHLGQAQNFHGYSR